MIPMVPIGKLRDFVVVLMPRAGFGGRGRQADKAKAHEAGQGNCGYFHIFFY